MTTPGQEPGGAEQQGAGRGRRGEVTRRPAWVAASLILVAASAAALGFAAGSRAATAGDPAELASPEPGQEVETGCAAVLPPGHPSLGEGLHLPPGHPPIGDGLLPPGHPPVGAFPHLPAGHPPIRAEPLPLLQVEPPATFAI